MCSHPRMDRVRVTGPEVTAGAGTKAPIVRAGRGLRSAVRGLTGLPVGLRQSSPWARRRNVRPTRGKERQSQPTGVPLRVVHVWQMSALAAAATVGSHHFWEAAAGDARARATRRVVHTLGNGSAPGTVATAPTPLQAASTGQAGRSPETVDERPRGLARLLTVELARGNGRGESGQCSSSQS